MDQIKEIDQEIKCLKEKRDQLIRAKTITVGELFDLIRELEDKESSLPTFDWRIMSLQRVVTKFLDKGE